MKSSLWITLVLVSLLLCRVSNAMVSHKERLESLQPKFRAKIVKLVEWLEKEFPRGNITIASTMRTPQQQKKLYEKGNHVTQTLYSYHLVGQAVDIFFIKDGKIRPFSPRYFNLGTKAKELGLFWGGDFRTLKDFSHIETHSPIKSVRKYYANKKKLSDL